MARNTPQLSFVWTHPDWPRWRSDAALLAAPLAAARKAQGRVIGKAQAIGLDLIREALHAIWVDEALATAAIEGEKLDLAAVRSSVARRLGLPLAGPSPALRHVDGLLDIMEDAVARYDEPLSKERLCAWHAALFPTGRSGLREITVGEWRGGETPMRIVSGPLGREKVHYEAPPSKAVPEEMRRFLDWFGRSRSDGTDGLVRAALAHLWFETIHPFEDGNGRVGRALVDLALAQDSGVATRLFRMSSRLSGEREAYYRELKAAQRSALEATPWVSWFVAQFTAACGESEAAIEAALVKARFWAAGPQVNERQRKVLNALLDAGPGGFEGGMSTRKYSHMTGASRATASRELVDLAQKGLLRVTGRLKGTRYFVTVPGWE